LNRQYAAVVAPNTQGRLGVGYRLEELRYSCASYTKIVVAEIRSEDALVTRSITSAADEADASTGLPGADGGICADQADTAWTSRSSLATIEADGTTLAGAGAVASVDLDLAAVLAAATVVGACAAGALRLIHPASGLLSASCRQSRTRFRRSCSTTEN
jgi:hypothetical protein